eukprot:28338-Chlamydomonas_euryale.AAC.4
MRKRWSRGRVVKRLCAAAWLAMLTAWATSLRSCADPAWLPAARHLRRSRWLLPCDAMHPTAFALRGGAATRLRAPGRWLDQPIPAAALAEEALTWPAQRSMGRREEVTGGPTETAPAPDDDNMRKACSGRRRIAPLKRGVVASREHVARLRRSSRGAGCVGVGNNNSVSLVVALQVIRACASSTSPHGTRASLESTMPPTHETLAAPSCDQAPTRGVTAFFGRRRYLRQAEEAGGRGRCRRPAQHQHIICC